MITTSKQLAEALGPKWRASEDADRIGLREATFQNTQVLCGEPVKGIRATDGVTIVYRKSPRAAVLALADKLEAKARTLADRLEAEARALRESVKEGP